MSRMRPDVDAWYENVDSGQIFKVVAVDDESNTVEIQYRDGNVDEFDLSQWYQLPLASAAEPEDANVAFGEASEELMANSGGPTDREPENPLDTVEGKDFYENED